jgi:hypothetical protein
LADHDVSVTTEAKNFLRRVVQVTISPTFYAQLFCTKVLRKASLYLHFRFVIFWNKNIGAKASRKIEIEGEDSQKSLIILSAIKKCSCL